MIVAKFGGTSVGNAERIKNLIEIIRCRLEEKPIVVVSAISGVTNLLIELSNSPISKRKKIVTRIKNIHYEIAQELELSKSVFTFIDKKTAELQKIVKKKKFFLSEIDKILSFGEIFSSYIVENAFLKNGIDSIQVISTKLIITNNNFGEAEFLPEKTKKRVSKILNPILKRGKVPIVTGFIGSTQDGKITTLGRGGSDYSASIIGFCLHVKEIQIWTDVDGIFTTDPRAIKNAQIIPEISFKEASELATFGAKVLHPKTIKPAIVAKIPVRVMNSFSPNNPGTVILEKSHKKKSVTAIAFKRKITLVNIYSEDMLLKKGFLAKVFKVFADNDISVDLVSVSEVSISITIDSNYDIERVIKKISEFARVSVERNLGTISLVGEKIITIPNIMKNIFSVLNDYAIPVRMVSLGAIDINISFVIYSQFIDQALELLHNATITKSEKFFLKSNNQPSNFLN